MRIAVIMAIVAGAAVAHADVIRLGYRFGTTFECSALWARPVGDRWRVTMQVVVSTTDVDLAERTTVLEVPHGIAMAVTRGNASVVAVDSSLVYDHVRLRVADVARDHPATIDLELIAPHVPAVEDRYGRVVATVVPVEDVAPHIELRFGSLMEVARAASYPRVWCQPDF